MAEPALSRMTVEEFLLWDSGDDKRYELIAGRPVAMNPPASAHRTVASRLDRRIAEALDARPSCRLQLTSLGLDLAMARLYEDLARGELRTPD